MQKLQAGSCNSYMKLLVLLAEFYTKCFLKALLMTGKWVLSQKQTDPWKTMRWLNKGKITICKNAALIK